MTGAFERIRESEELSKLPETLPRAPAPEGAVVRRLHNSPLAHAGSNFPAQIYPGHPHNFTPLKPPQPGFSALDRAVRDSALESRFDLLERRIMPRYAAECVGTPRQQLLDGTVGGIRVRPVQNLFVELKRSMKYRLNTWPSKDWASWTPQRVSVRGGRRKYRLPEDIAPYKDELGEWHPPRVSGRLKGDIEKQFWMNSLPWVWDSHFYSPQVHFMDREAFGKKYWYKKEYHRAQVAEALRRADSMVEDYRKERREAKRLSWVESITAEFAGEQLAAPYVRTRRLPKF